MYLVPLLLFLFLSGGNAFYNIPVHKDSGAAFEEAIIYFKAWVQSIRTYTPFTAEKTVIVEEEPKTFWTALQEYVGIAEKPQTEENKNVEPYMVCSAFVVLSTLTFPCLLIVLLQKVFISRFQQARQQQSRTMTPFLSEAEDHEDVEDVAEFEASVQFEKSCPACSCEKIFFEGGDKS